MIDITISGLVKEFEVGSRILDGLTFQVDSGERVGLLGKNGAGKTTVFRMLTGQLEPDEGQASVAPGRRVGLISQIPVYPAGYTVEDVLQTAFDRLHSIEEEISQVAAQMGKGEVDPSLPRRYDQLIAAFEAGGGYDTDTRLAKVCNGLGISQEMCTQQFSNLSGGEKTRINLARLILEDTDILLLDEPTNHLDLHATEWLEEYLHRFKGTVLAISHDRWFLDRVVKRIVEISQGRAEFYAGNYSFYVEEKERRYQERMKQYEKEQAKIAQLTKAAEQMRLWAFKGNDKQYRRAINMERRAERMDCTDRPKKERAMSARFQQGEFHGDMALAVVGVGKGFEGRTLFTGVNLEVTSGERIGLLGDNGTGKSTFLKLIMEEDSPSAGHLYKGPTVKLGYLPQQVVFSNPERNLVDTMLYETNCTTQEARDRLAAFRFRGEDVFKSVSSLSGGEQSRLRLCMLMEEKVNFLILDEPTNHLDVASREWIEEAVESYDGNLLFVSHDRYFIDKFATRIWVIENGTITDFRGDFRAYRAMLERKQQTKHMQTPAKEEPKKDRPKTPGGTKQLEKDVKAAERAVTKAEERIYELTCAMEECASDYLKLRELCEQRDVLEDELAQLYAKWERLAAELEEARG